MFYLKKIIEKKKIMANNKDKTLPAEMHVQDVQTKMKQKKNAVICQFQDILKKLMLFYIGTILEN